MFPNNSWWHFHIDFDISFLSIMGQEQRIKLCVMPASYMDLPLAFHFNFRTYPLIDMSYLLFTRLGSWPTSFMDPSLVISLFISIINIILFFDVHARPLFPIPFRPLLLSSCCT